MWPSRRGKAPERAIAYQLRVESVVQAMQTAMPEFSSASSTSIQAPPHSRWATTNAGFSDDAASVSRRLTPQPTCRPQAQKT